MLQNRVDPSGNIIATSARGTWLGNRGQLHGNGKTILRPFKHKAWISCQLQFKNRHREIMAPGLWTELFFLDEATAFSAGHRPCFECRREAALQFKRSWIAGNPEYGYNMKTSIRLIDDVLHTERIDAQFNKITFTTASGKIPNGAFVRIDDEPYLVLNKKRYLWTPLGYGAATPLIEKVLEILTPRSICNAFTAAYQTQISL